MRAARFLSVVILHLLFRLFSKSFFLKARWRSQTLPTAQPRPYAFAKAALTRSVVNGTLRSLMSVASKMALASAAATGALDAPPAPLGRLFRPVDRPVSCLTGVMHERAALLLTSTVRAPPWPGPQTEFRAGQRERIAKNVEEGWSRSQES